MINSNDGGCVAAARVESLWLMAGEAKRDSIEDHKERLDARKP